MIKKELQNMWNISSPWQLIPLGKGYYTIVFQNAEDKQRAKAKLIWEVFNGHLRLREWAKNFDPFKELSSLANVWIRIHYLPIEYWHAEVLAGIARFVGHPLKIDGASITRDFGQFARVLVELDMSKSLPTTLLFDGGDYSFHVEFTYEYLPYYCSKCKITGHSPDKCRKANLPVEATMKPSGKQQAIAKQWQEVSEPGISGGESIPVGLQSEQVRASPAHGNNLIRQEVVEEQHAVQQKVSSCAATLIENSFAALESSEQVVTSHEDVNERDDRILSGPDSLEVVLVPVTSEHQLDDNDEDVDEDIEMETPNGVVNLAKNVAAAAEEGNSLRNETLALKDAVAEKQSEVGTDGFVSEQVHSPIQKEVVGDKQSNPTPEDIAGRISRLEEQVNQGMLLLSEPKRGRGRPKGSGKGSELGHAVPTDSIKNRLKNAEGLGFQPSNFVVDHSSSNTMRTMNNIANLRWSDVIAMENDRNKDDYHSNMDFNI
ncbi:uncharacterized protein LOC131018657 [Salvia miltiorrhiza]|uniref:uncharacterized protein LOC131018657 n=1 Tax=Salvia miltiorrhiza TaxID=226208 RepID=UPI0025AD7E8E|nr:uncharacterized protein LOC131018657 [Salvia miltiorrhiza]